MSEQLADVIAHASPRRRLDEQFIVDFAQFRPDPTRTPYVGVGRIPPGHTGTWRGAGSEPVIEPYCAPGAWSDPDVEGSDLAVRYLDVFDRAVDDMVRPGEPIAATMSAGLDSTFVVGSLVRHATSERPVVAYHHRPHPDAGLGPIGNWDADEYRLATEMESFTDGRVRVEPIVNVELTQPLDVAAVEAERTWAPVFNPANMIWITEAQRRARDVGASVLFFGENGNPAFSADHPYALRHHLRQHEWDRARTVWRRHRDAGLSRYRITRRHLIGPAVRAARARRYGGRATPELLDILGTQGTSVPVAPLDRRRFEGWLARDHALNLCIQGGAGYATITDPFTDRGVLDLTAAITPAEWGRYGPDRAYARHLAAGRIPDSIRLRTRRGGQAWDGWFIIRNERERYLDEVRSLTTTPILGDRVDVAELEAEVASWPWGEIGPAPQHLIAVDRILALAIFVRSATTRLQTLPQS